VTYRIDGKLHDARLCHCSRCRKAFNSQASAYAIVEPKEFRWVSGESLLTTYESQQGFSLQFCSKCGSTLSGIYQNVIHGVTLGCVNGDPKIKLGKHIYVGSKASWEVIAEGVPQFDEAPPTNV
jgi:hypothetical protein